MNNRSRQALVRATLRSCSGVVAAIIFPLLLASCANVTFHPGVPAGTTPDLSKQTGLKYYTAKPYLLIGPTGNKDAPLKAEIISLPDLEHPTYAIYHPGWGSHNFSLAVASNGDLSSYGQTADSKIPETIAALGSVLGSAAAFKGTAAVAASSSTPSKFVSVQGIGQYVQDAIDELSNISKIPHDPNGLVEANARTAAKLIEDLKKCPLEDPEACLSKLSEAIKDSAIPDAGRVEVAVNINSYYKKARKNVDLAIKAIQAGQPAKPDFRLFEIQMKNGKTCLIPADCRLASEAIKHWEYK